MAASATRSPAPESSTDAPLIASRGRVVPCIGGALLLAAAFPACAAKHVATARPELPRLRLALAIASFETPAPGSDNSIALPASVDPQSDVPLARLKLSSILERSTASPGGATTSGNPSPTPSAPNDTGRDTPPPVPDERRNWREKNAIPSRRPSGSAKAQASESQFASGATTPPQEGRSNSTDNGNKTRSAVSGNTNDAKVVGGDEFLPADELEPELPSVRRGPVTNPASAGGSADAPTATKRGWGMAPVRWGATLGTGIQQMRSGNGDSTTSEVYEARIRASSYIWAPYIALVSGDFGLTTNHSASSSSDGSASSNNLTGTSINGSGSLSLFPQSRFPLTATLALTDSRSMGSFNDTNVQYRRLGLQQNYRPYSGGWNASGGYDRSEVTGEFGTDTVDRLHGNYSTFWEGQNLSASASTSRSESDTTSYSDFFVNGSHSYQYSEELSLSTSGTYTSQDFTTRPDEHNSKSSNIQTGSAQLFSVANWNPLDSKWRGSGTLRYFQITSNSNDGASLKNSVFGGSAGLNYQASRNLSLFGSFGFNANNTSSTSTFESLGASYSGDPLTFGQYSYTWSTSLSGSNSSSSEGDASRSVSSSANHSVSRSWVQGDKGLLSASLSQSVSASQASGQGATSAHSLSHSASLSYSAYATDNLNGFLSAGLSDTRTFGQTQGAFQTLNMQLSGQWRINAYSAMSSNLSWQMSRQQSESSTQVVFLDEFGRPVSVNNSTQNRNSSISGNLSYTHSRFLGLRGLRYGLDFRANTARDESRRFGNPDAFREPDRATLELDQRLGYRIGRLDTQLQYRIAEIAGSRNQLIYLRLSRDFGAF